ncbi:neutral/alkaline ceramidase [Streptomyces sp. ISL-98]|uniref:neutral/alkaline ceramidase n=1 Tax=Streptomyces sp. ISL-98 TaxID=2819192 RepID=UPI001BECB9FC|nr:neutral/alkaline ceramidase [Streptomyces sp. ISL-98]MBT2508372.1 neutral/alkaline ceramidase [Streptomyces sp. ISL-98]
MSTSPKPHAVGPAHRPSRWRTTAVVTALALLGIAAPAAAEDSTPTPAAEPYLVGRGIADATGEVAATGMMGYGRTDQVAEGLHTRLRSRSFVIVDRATGRRVLLIVADSPMIFESVHQRVLKRLAERYGGLYTEQNVLITATHSHSGPGGYSHHLLYNLTTKGYHEKTFAAITDGMVESVTRAQADLAPASLTLTHGELHHANVNRSRTAFDNNRRDKEFFPEARDPQTSLLRIERGGRPVGAINWFPTHNTSMTGENKLISSDNKGYAAYRWERESAHVDYLADAEPDFVSAFAQTNAGDMSPNIALKPADELPATEFESTREIGLRQYDAAHDQLDDTGQRLDGAVDSRLTYVDLANTTVGPAFTGDGREHRTCKPAIGAAMAAGSTEDGPAFPVFKEGENPVWDAVSKTVLYGADEELKQCQSPKGIVVPIGGMNAVYPWVQEQVPVQLVRIGGLYLVGVPGEVTVVAGLRLRRTVAEIVGADIKNVLVAGYSNAYMHYVTTPEEYDKQQYEGGSTLFGRWELPALQQTAAGLATSMRAGEPVPRGSVPPDLSGRQLFRQPDNGPDTPPLGRRFGDVLTEPAASYSGGQQAAAVFVGAHPNNNLHRNGTYLEVQRLDGSNWRRVADDGDWSTKFRWKREGLTASRTTVTWDIPADAEPGSYRIRYHGDARNVLGGIGPFTATSRTFEVKD